ncbi:MAG: hypothetical protein EXR73_04700, partial [Myxococcales bacterium]|nr:hypothetical protein [Myxococcales bacterium]
MIPAIVVHGGAGTVSDEHVAASLVGCAAAARVGLAVLLGGGSALDAVQAATRVLEDDPQFNAGVGSALTRDGTVETEASLMEGTTLRAGGVAAVPNLGCAIEVARAVLEDGEHLLLCGEGAWAFARERGFVPAAAEALVTERQRRALAEELLRRRVSGGVRAPAGGGTVGACAIDAAGRVAAATSTGGITGKRCGRIGDSPLIGCGTYADDGAGAASATGHGESIIRVTMTRGLVERMRAGSSAEEAAWGAVDELATRGAGGGGVICVDARGRIGVAHNTVRMPHA